MTTCFTGDIPTVALCGPEEEIVPLDDLSWTAQSILWHGCIDAPDVVPAGGVRWSISIGQVTPSFIFRPFA